MRNIVIVGAGTAGLRTAAALRERGFGGRLTLVGEEAHRPYSRPPLSKEALTGVGLGEGPLAGNRALRLLEDAEIDALDLDFLPGTRAVGLDTASRTVRLDDGGGLPYDGLVVATGARARRPDTALAGVHVLRTLEDAEAVRARIAEHGRLVVVGAGFVGAEVAASARALGAEVTLVEAAPTPLTRVVHPRLGSVLTELHRENGVDVRLGTGVRAYEGSGRVERVRLADGGTVQTPLVVAGIGVDLNTEWLRGSLDLMPDGSVRCDEYSAASAPGVYAVGDLANWPHPRYGGRVRLEHWTNAGEQAAAAAHNLLADPRDRRPFTPVPYFWSDQYKMKIQLLGQGAPADEVAIVHGSAQDRKFVAFLGRGGMLTGVLGLRSTPRTMRYRGLLERPTTWEEALAATAS